MQTASSTYVKEADNENLNVLNAFGAAFAERPIDIEAVDRLREEVRAVGGDGLVMEASTIAGAFSLMTKVVDATGRKPEDQMLEKTIAKFSSYN